MQKTAPDNLGAIVKEARENAKITVENLAEQLNVTERYIYRIENEGKKPSFEILYKLIRILSINPDAIFYPEKPSKELEVENLTRLLHSCDERTLEIIKAAVYASIRTAPEKLAVT